MVPTHAISHPNFDSGHMQRGRPLLGGRVGAVTSRLANGRVGPVQEGRLEPQCRLLAFVPVIWENSAKMTIFRGSALRQVDYVFQCSRFLSLSLSLSLSFFLFF